MTRGASEESVVMALQLEASRRGCELWRNNSGALKNERGQMIRFGLGNTSPTLNARWKSSDLIGIFPRLITADMVGQRIGQFAAIEVKKPGWSKPTDDREIAQQRFIASVIAMGGYAQFAQDVKDVFR